MGNMVGVVAMAKDCGSNDEPPKSKPRPTMKCVPSFSTIIALARALSVPPGEILNERLRLRPVACDHLQPFEEASPEIQEAILTFLRAFARRRLT